MTYTDHLSGLLLLGGTTCLVWLASPQMAEITLMEHLVQVYLGEIARLDNLL